MCQLLRSLSVLHMSPALRSCSFLVALLSFGVEIAIQFISASSNIYSSKGRCCNLDRGGVEIAIIFACYMRPCGNRGCASSLIYLLGRWLFRFNAISVTRVSVNTVSIVSTYYMPQFKHKRLVIRFQPHYDSFFDESKLGPVPVSSDY